MKPFKLLVAIGAVGVMGITTPAFAQRGGGNHGGGSHGGGHVADGGASRGVAPRGPAMAAQRGPAPRSGPVNEARRASGPAFARSGVYTRGGGGSRWVGSGYERGYGYWRAFGGRVVVGPTHFLRPYYAFRPRVSLGFGIWAGYPLAYSYGFYDPFWDGPYAYAAPYPAPYPYADPYAYSGSDPSAAYPPASSPYPPAAAQSQYPPADQNSVNVEPSQQNMGGLSFEITPATAQLFVDGRAAGTVGEFTPTTQPLGLPAGRHQIEVQAPGYQTLTFDVDIVAGQVIPYQGTLTR